MTFSHSGQQEPKAENIARLADTLNLGLDSFVFLDGNPVEQEAVRRALPGLQSLTSPEMYLGCLSSSEACLRPFFTTRVTDECENSAVSAGSDGGKPSMQLSR